MSTPAQLRIAARIHYALKEALGEGIDVAAMLSQPQEAIEVLFVCEASGIPELVSLGRQFAAACQPVVTRHEPAPVTPPDAPQDAAWASNSSGFGVSRPADFPDAPAGKGWRSAAQRLFRPTR